MGDVCDRVNDRIQVHNLATDSKGNLYTTETYTGARVQRFLFKGVKPVTRKDQGVPWPQAGR